MLKAVDVNTHYGKLHVLKGISLEVEKGELAAVIGANGAGKTTLMKTLSGIVQASSGRIEFLGAMVNGMRSNELVRRGICLVPEGRHCFPRMSIWENLMLGAYARRDKKAVKNDLELVYNYFPILEQRSGEQAGTLSGGQQQVLVIGRGLMSHPKLLLLDEPSLGLAPLVVKEIFQIIKELNRSGTTVILVEQNAMLALEVAQKTYVLETGMISLQGLASELKNNAYIREAYLGA